MELMISSNRIAALQANYHGRGLKDPILSRLSALSLDDLGQLTGLSSASIKGITRSVPRNIQLKRWIADEYEEDLSRHELLDASLHHEALRISDFLCTLSASRKNVSGSFLQKVAGTIGRERMERCLAVDSAGWDQVFGGDFSFGATNENGLICFWTWFDEQGPAVKLLLSKLVAVDFTEARQSQGRDIYDLALQIAREVPRSEGAIDD